ncbi:amidohydrolase family protein [Elioraea thermophila]|uniref:amidohydrolase family protein n=1 Tax=Elioraea thermophila TaxID=2185104 RepID=UPI000DF17938|nr:amidohydrolase family protein [Elioraea thermophila]
MSEGFGPRRIVARTVADPDNVRRDVALSLVEGRIAAVEPDTAADASLLVLPALVNAHDHARPVRSSSLGAAHRPLETWLHHLAILPPLEPYLAAAVALGRAALGGAGAVMVHYTRPFGPMPLPDEAAEVARAARDVGVRIGFAVAMRDRNPLVYGDHGPLLAALSPADRAAIEARLVRPPVPPAEWIALVDAVADRIADDMVSVQYGPAGPQWCSDALLAAIAEASARTGRRIHMHLLETRYQRDWADRTYPGPGGIVAHLERLGLLCPRLTLAHCVWARPDELERIAASGATIAVNTSSNLGLRSGVAPVAEMLRRGCRVALGVDGMAFDEDDDGLREMRLFWALHRGWGFDETIPRATMLALAFRNGCETVTGRQEGGTLAVGEPADLLLLDADALDGDRLLPECDLLDLLFARGTARHIRELIVAGRSVVRDGRLTGVDHAALSRELLARARAGLARPDAFAAALPALDRAIASHLCGCLGCG